MLALQPALHGASRLNGRIGVVAVVAVVSGVLLLTQLNDRDLWSSHEARAAQNAVGFLETGDWGVLRSLDGTADHQKPPLYYWLVAAFAWLRGGTVDAVAVRLPAALAGWLLTILVSLTLRRRPIAALVAGLSLATACHFVAIARTGRTDVPVAFAVAAALFAIRARSRPMAAVTVAGFSIAAALLLKGPIGLALILATGLTIWLVDRSDGINLRYGLVAGALGMALAAPWFVAATWETSGEFARVFFWHHNVMRAAGTADDLARHPAWYYIARWFIDWLPWSPAVLASAGVAIRSGWWRCDVDLRYGAAWAIGITGLLTLSQFKRADYLIPAYAGAAIGLGCVAERAYLTISIERRNPVLRWAATAFAGVVVAYVALEVTLVPRWNRQWERQTDAAAVRQHVHHGEQIIFFRVEDHLLAFHLGKPIATVLEWENLATWLARPQSCWVVMPAETAADWPVCSPPSTLHEVARLPDRTSRRRPRDLVLFRNEAKANDRSHQPRID